ncbi:hypothetical protein ACRALDRAFT_1059610 [Sodiomyces alcalophilus JCM 7366]|uniref:uncharacterized protein n=1 Tax=Sodiomyces alcalophilus JCM 7366 TaxID=591952 RepID=UPI0039B5A5D1
MFSSIMRNGDCLGFDFVLSPRTISISDGFTVIPEWQMNGEIGNESTWPPSEDIPMAHLGLWLSMAVGFSIRDNSPLR